MNMTDREIILKATTRLMKILNSVQGQDYLQQIGEQAIIENDVMTLPKSLAGKAQKELTAYHRGHPKADKFCVSLNEEEWVLPEKGRGAIVTDDEFDMRILLAGNAVIRRLETGLIF